MGINDVEVVGFQNLVVDEQTTYYGKNEAQVKLLFPEIEIKGETEINDVKGKSSLKMYNVNLMLKATYDDQNNVLEISELQGHFHMERANVSIESSRSF